MVRCTFFGLKRGADLSRYQFIAFMFCRLLHSMALAACSFWVHCSDLCGCLCLRQSCSVSSNLFCSVIATFLSHSPSYWLNLKFVSLGSILQARLQFFKSVQHFFYSEFTVPKYRIPVEITTFLNSCLTIRRIIYFSVTSLYF